MTKLRAWRTERAWTLRETAGLAGMSVSMISRVERGQRDLAPETKVLVARRLGARLEDLFDLPADDDSAAVA